MSKLRLGGLDGRGSEASNLGPTRQGGVSLFFGMSENPPTTDEEEALIEQIHERGQKVKKARKQKHTFWLRRVGVGRYNRPKKSLTEGVYAK